MGLLSSLIQDVVGSPIGELVTALFRPIRAIGPFVTQVTIEEVGIHELVATEHPVSNSAPITDHSYVKPSQVIIRCGFSNSGLAGAISQVAGLIAFANGNVGQLNYARQTLSNLIALQESRIPFTVVTGKRTYRNMLMKSIVDETDERSENVLMVTCHCQQIIMVQTQVTAIVNSNGVQATPAEPNVTGGVANMGFKNIIPTSAVSPGGALPESKWPQ